MRQMTQAYLTYECGYGLPHFTKDKTGFNDLH